MHQSVHSPAHHLWLHVGCTGQLSDGEPAVVHASDQGPVRRVQVLSQLHQPLALIPQRPRSLTFRHSRLSTMGNLDHGWFPFFWCENGFARL
jgi:hypothetical protein